MDATPRSPTRRVARVFGASPLQVAAPRGAADSAPGAGDDRGLGAGERVGQLPACRTSCCATRTSSPAGVVMYTFYTEGGQANLPLISAFSLLYSMPVVVAVPVRQPPLRLPLPWRDQELMASIDTRRTDQGLPRGSAAALDALDLTIADGEFFALLGPSGCGKTTLLRTIAGLEEATGGRAPASADRDVTDAAAGQAGRGDGLPGLRALPAHGRHRQHRLPAAHQEGRRASSGARRRPRPAPGSGCRHLMERRPGQLSGGQQQRVALARAMACQPDVFLLDEPLSNLDARLRLEARTFLKRLQHELGVTTVFVTHDQAEALAMADRIAVMEAGTIRQLGTPVEIFHRPANTFVADFIGSTPMNLLPGSAVGDRGRGGRRTCSAGGLAPASTPIYGVDPSALLRAAGSSRVVIVENLGASMLVTVPGRRAAVQAVVPEGEEPDVGTEVTICPGPGAGAVLRRRRAASSSGRVSRRCGELMSHGAALLDLRSTWTPHHRAEWPLQELEVEVPARRRGHRGRALLRRRWRRGARPRPGGAGRVRRVVRRGPWPCRGLHRLGHAGIPPGAAGPGPLAGAHRPAPGAPARRALRPPGHGALTRRGRGRAARRRGARTAACPGPGPTAVCPGSTGCSGLPATSTPTPCTPTAPVRRRARGARRLAWARLPGGHRPQHGQPPPRARRRGRALRHHAAAGAGGHHRPWPRQRLRRHRLGRLPRAGDSWQATVAGRGGLLSVNHPLAADCCWQPSWPSPQRGRDLALVVAAAGPGARPLAWWQAWAGRRCPSAAATSTAWARTPSPGADHVGALPRTATSSVPVAAGPHRRQRRPAGPPAAAVWRRAGRCRGRGRTAHRAGPRAPCRARGPRPLPRRARPVVARGPPGPGARALPLSALSAGTAPSRSPTVSAGCAGGRQTPRAARRGGPAGRSAGRAGCRRPDR